MSLLGKIRKINIGDSDKTIRVFDERDRFMDINDNYKGFYYHQMHLLNEIEENEYLKAIRLLKEYLENELDEETKKYKNFIVGSIISHSVWITGLLASVGEMSTGGDPNKASELFLSSLLAATIIVSAEYHNVSRIIAAKVALKKLQKLNEERTKEKQEMMDKTKILENEDIKGLK